MTVFARGAMDTEMKGRGNHREKEGHIMAKTRTHLWFCGIGRARFSIFLLLILTATASHAAVWYVNTASSAITPDGKTWATAYPDLQSAQKDAASGDEVWVAKGTYIGTSAEVVWIIMAVGLYGGFLGNETFREQRDGTANPTIIDGQNARGCVWAGNGAFLDGFWIQHGYGDIGAGMYNGTAINCTFTENEARRDGGGAYNCTANNCIFAKNSAKRYGGGIYGGTANNCTFMENTASSGGGIYSGTANNCTLTGNSASYSIDYEDSSNGGGMCSSTANNCTFMENTASSGGGIYGSRATNCTVTGNSAYYGGGMYDSAAANCTVTRNAASDGGGMYGGTARNCIIWGNRYGEARTTSVSFSCLSEENPGEGNITSSPRFVDPWADDVRLRIDSPCINAASPDGAPVTDLLGRVRPQGAGVDMGAYEYTPGDDANAVIPPTLLRVNAASTAANPDGLTWETAFSTLQAAADRAGSGTEIWVVQGTYTAVDGDQVLLLEPYTTVYGGFSGTETSRDQRSSDATVTVIDGGGKLSCVNANPSSVVDGFTLKNGYSAYGAGMYNGTCVNCIFNANHAYDSGALYEGNAVNCVFSANQGGAMRGGTAINCAFNGNTAVEGGAMYGGTATNCSFTNNTAAGYWRWIEGWIKGLGGALYGTAATDCSFFRNHADDQGGGMYEGAAVNCLFLGNQAWRGGGIYNGSAMSCTLSKNMAEEGGGAHGGTCVNCIVWGNTAEETAQTVVSYSCTSSLTPGTGNIAADPRFVNTVAEDFRLCADSPCIDAGTPEGAPGTDLPGRPRPQGAGTDMGAYEYHAGDDAHAVPTPLVLRVTGAATAQAPDGLTWETAFPTLQAAADHAGFGTEIWVAQGTYTASGGDQVLLLLWPGTSVYGGFSGTETARDARNPNAESTVIDGQGSRRCVAANALALVDGFTLQRGRAGGGAGMCCGTAVNCVFANNDASGSGHGGVGGGMFRGNAYGCTFTANSCGDSSETGWGGGMFDSNADHCAFIGNYCFGDSGRGGGMSGGTASNCFFTGNCADSGGGMSGGSATNCKFLANYTGQHVVCGGGRYESPCYTVTGCGGGTNSCTVVNSIFAENSAGSGAGSYDCRAVNCVFARNMATENFSGGADRGELVNCILRHNMPTDIAVRYYPSSTASYCCLSIAFEGEGNIVADPLFVDEASGNFRLQPTSPCIDTGTGEGAPVADMLGVPRPQGARSDMGAHETVVFTTVPEVSGLARATARELVAAAQLYVDEESEEYNRTIPSGHVVRQLPVSGTQVPQRTPVDLTVSKGPEPVQVPDVVGQTQDAAAVSIAGADLGVGAVTQHYSLIVPAGVVISQSPLAGTLVLPESTVDLVVSRGGIAVPDLAGQTLSSALTALGDAQLAAGTIIRQYSVSVPAGSVVSQTPAPDTQVLPGTAVDMVVSLGAVTVPNVSGSPLNAAMLAVTDAQLLIGRVTQVYNATVPVGSVVSETPPAGTLVFPETRVELVVSRGVQPVAMPDVVGMPRGQAAAAITGAGLVLGTVTQIHSDSVPSGNVIAQSPAAGAETLPGTTVSIVVSLGASPAEGEGEPVDADAARQQLADGFDAADKNSDGTLSFAEAGTAISGLTQAVFDELDTNGDSQLSADELGTVEDSGCTGCRGGKGAFSPFGWGKIAGSLF